MAGKHRTMIQKGQAVDIFEDNGCRNGKADDLAKDAGVHEIVLLVTSRLQLCSCFQSG